MAQTRTPARKKKKVTKIKFELAKGSIAGVAVVCFCLFLWMFLAGVWTGQSILSPHPSIKRVSASNSVTGPPPFIKAVEKKKIVLKKQ